MNTISDFKELTDKIGIYPDELGRLMLNFEPFENPGIPEEWMYYSSNQEEWFIKGFVGNKAHVTLKYGFLKKAYELKDEIEALVGDLALPQVRVWGATRFDNHVGGYSAIVLTLEDNPLLLEFSRRLSYLPHIDTFTPWVPHITVAYVIPEVANSAISIITKTMMDRILIPTDLNFGEDKY